MNKTKLTQLSMLVKDNELFDEKTGNKMVESNGKLIEMKYCFHCRKWKPLSDFYMYKGEFLPACKECKKQYYTERKQTLTNQEKLIEALQEKVHTLELFAEQKAQASETNQELTTVALTTLLKSIGKTVKTMA